MVEETRSWSPRGHRGPSPPVTLLLLLGGHLEVRCCLIRQCPSSEVPLWVSGRFSCLTVLVLSGPGLVDEQLLQLLDFHEMQVSGTKLLFEFKVVRLKPSESTFPSARPGPDDITRPRQENIHRSSPSCSPAAALRAALFLLKRGISS